MPKPMISVVVPVYDEEGSLEVLASEIRTVLGPLPNEYEVIFVNDGSRDGSTARLAALHKDDPTVKVVELRDNFGKSVALSVGFEHANGEIIFTMDADLQDDPKEIPRFLEKIEEGYDLVSGWKFKRHDPVGKTFPSKIFNRVVSMMTGIKLHDFNCGFKCYRRVVVQNVRIYGELHRFVPVLARWKGFRVAEIKVDHHPRLHGVSKYGVERFTRGFLDLLTVLFLTRYLKRPLHLFGGIGLFCLVPGLLLSAWFVIQWLIGVPMHVRPFMVFGWVAIILGIQFISMGLLGEMLIHSFHTYKQREDPSIIRRTML
ncbi:MAG: glycosyltransferase family 2 protein [Deltaproteobacteria bacterium]|nr:glycosyltransferase family 2 protein [Deltaproteobacteria bacterium]